MAVILQSIMHHMTFAYSRVQTYLRTLHQQISQQIQAGGIALSEPLKKLPEKQNQLKKTRKNNYFKSQFSSQDRLKVSKLKQQMISFEKQLSLRTKSFDERVHATIQQQKQQKQTKIKQQASKHRQQLRIKRKINKLAQSKRKQEMSLHQQRERNRSSLKRMYQNKQEEWSQKQQKEEEERKTTLALIQAQKQALVSIQQLKEHDNKYMQQLKTYQSERVAKAKQIKSAMKNFEQKEMKNKLKSHFYHQYEQNIILEKHKEDQKMSFRRQNKQKLQNFLSKLQSQSQPKMMLRKTSSESSNETPITRKGKTYTEIKQQGNKYLRQCLSQVRNHPLKHITQPSVQSSSKTKTAKDYLAQLRQKNQNKAKVNLIAQTQTKINRILAVPLSQEQRIEKLRKLAHSLQTQGYHNTIQMNMERAQAKFRILQAVMTQNPNR